MTAIFKLTADEFDSPLTEKIKSLFGRNPIEISIVEQDTTEYLLSSPASRKRLNESLHQLEEGNVVEIDPAEYR